MAQAMILYFDGSCRGKNPGGIASFAWRLLDENGNQLVQHSGVATEGPLATNNLAEWTGLLEGLKYLKEQNYKGTLAIYGDSQLVINQLNGEYQCKKETLIPLYKESLDILKNMKWTANWIGRDHNHICDKLAKKAK